MTHPSQKPSHPTHIAGLVALKLLGSGFVLWLPLIGWELGERWSANQPLRSDRPPSRWSTPAPPEPNAGAMAKSPLSQPVFQLTGSPRVDNTLANQHQASLSPALYERAQAEPLLSHTAGSGSFGGGGLSETDPWLLTSLKFAAGLGGEINLENVNEKVMPVAALAERQHWQRSGDPLSPLPRHWRDDLRRELGKDNKFVQAEVVRIPAPHVITAEEIPLAIHGNGQADSLVPPASAQSQQIVETWASRQSPVKEGVVRAVVVTLEPIDLSKNGPQAPEPAWGPKAELAPAAVESGSTSESTSPQP